MKTFFPLILALLAACRPDPVQPEPPVRELVRAADMSFLPEIEAFPTTYYTADGTPEDPLATLRRTGCNSVRLRLWKDPATPHSSLAEVATLAQRIRAQGMSVWLTVHYADTWADPGHQPTPAAWQGLSREALADSVYDYTRRVIELLQPEIVQIGNEINGGLLWPTGRIADEAAMKTLLTQAARAVRAHSPASQIMVHYAGHAEAYGFFDKLRDLDYDLIGLSYYPLWHGKDIDALAQKIEQLGQVFDKDVLIAETAYPFTLGWSDWTNNIAGLDEQLVDGYPATPAGQKAFLLRLRTLLEAAPRGKGFCYWGAEWIAFKGDNAADGSSWENQALWDFDHRALPALDVFAE
ncbi:MAG: hypothetical protein OHK0039_34330 [Bacteroidia bacterium]